MEFTADEVWTMVLNLLQHQADVDGNGEIDWQQSVMEFTDWLETLNLKVTIEE